MTPEEFNKEVLRARADAFGKAENELIDKILQAEDASVSKRDMLGLNKKHK